MSGTHHLHTVTGRALPVPPKRTPSRRSTIARLPEHRAEEQEQIIIRAKSSGRVETPRGGEFSVLSRTQMRSSQLVVYSGVTHDPPSDGAPSRMSAISPSSRSPQSLRPAIPSDASDRPQQRHAGSWDRNRREELRIHSSSQEDERSDEGGRTCSASEHSSPGIKPASPVRLQRSAASHESPTLSDPSPVAQRFRSTAKGVALDDTPTPLPPSPAQRSESTRGSRRRLHYNSTNAAPSGESGAVASVASDTGVSRKGYSASEECSMRENKYQRETPFLHHHVDPQYAVDHSNSTRTSPSVGVLNPRQNHEYSQQQMEEHRPSQQLGVSSTASHRSAARGHQPVEALATAWRGSRFPRKAEDPLEMNIPIAERMYATIASESQCVRAGTPMATTLEGTELLPSLPRLQGRKDRPNADRSYHTIVRFIEYQPEAERQGLERMLENYAGREEELCNALGILYGDDFAYFKTLSFQELSVPLLTQRQGRASPPAMWREMEEDVFDAVPSHRRVFKDAEGGEKSARTRQRAAVPSR